MKPDELLPALHELPRADKFRAVQLLTAELAQGEGCLLPGSEYPIWSPSRSADWVLGIGYWELGTGN